MKGSLDNLHHSEEIEVLVASRALQFASEIGLSQVALEGDPQVLMARLNADSEVLTTCGLLIVDVCRCSNYFTKLCYSHT